MKPSTEEQRGVLKRKLLRSKPGVGHERFDLKERTEAHHNVGRMKGGRCGSSRLEGLLGASVRRGGVVVVTRGRCRWSMVEKSWAEEAVCRQLMHVIKTEARPL